MNTSDYILTPKQSKLFDKLLKLLEEIKDKTGVDITSGSINILSNQQLTEVTQEMVSKLIKDIKTEAEKITSLPDITRV